MPFFLIDKPKWVSSRAITSKVQHDLQVKAGHAGTLDPFATGLLVIATEGDTRLIDKFSSFPKTYEGTFIFGQTSSTLDPEGEIIQEKIPDFTIDQLDKTIKSSFLGKISQIPPHYSAVKVKGKRAYDLARNNKDFSLTPVTREIFAYKILKKINQNTFIIEFTVSNGTYIRALARDIAKKMQTVGMLLELKRTKIGPFLLEAAQSSEEKLVSLTDPYTLLGLEKIQVNEIEIQKLLNGQEVELSYNNKECLFYHGNIVLFCGLRENGKYKIQKRIS